MVVPAVAIEPADLDEPAFVAFLEAHIRDTLATAPPESCHVLDLEDLSAAGVRVWVARHDGSVVGTIATAPVEVGHEELKSMRTDPSLRRSGIGTQLLTHAISDASERGVSRLSLETGSMEFFDPARNLYRRHGFEECQPFGSYVLDPLSVFMTRRLP